MLLSMTYNSSMGCAHYSGMFSHRGNRQVCAGVLCHEGTKNFYLVCKNEKHVTLLESV